MVLGRPSLPLALEQRFLPSLILSPPFSDVTSAQQYLCDLHGATSFTYHHHFLFPLTYYPINMTGKLLLLLQITLSLLSSLSLVSAFTMNSIPNARHPHCDLPGDPSLILQTNVDLGDKKADVMKELSALVAKSLGKPESYVGK